jgi:RES domain
MPPARPGPEPEVARVVWRRATRIIASRYPPIDLFERVTADPAVWEALIAAEMLVNPRVRDQVGEIALVPPDERISGPGASYVMASFTHRNPKGSRFSDGSYGVYYAAIDFRTALVETAFHFARFAGDSGDGIRHEDMRVLVGSVDETFHAIASLPANERAAVLDPDSYVASRALGGRLRAAGSNGVVWPSVRHAGGTCLGAFRPRAVRPPVQSWHIRYRYDGVRVTAWFDYGASTWHSL